MICFFGVASGTLTLKKLNVHGMQLVFQASKLPAALNRFKLVTDMSAVWTYLHVEHLHLPSQAPSGVKVILFVQRLYKAAREQPHNKGLRCQVRVGEYEIVFDFSLECRTLSANLNLG